MRTITHAKKAVAVLAAAVAAAALAGGEPADAKARAAQGGAENRARPAADVVRPKSRSEVRKMSKSEYFRYVGGWIYSEPTGKVIRVVNAQKLVPASVIDPMVEGFRVTMGLTLMKAESAAGGTGGVFSAVREGFASGKTGAVLALVDDPDAPRILCAPEEAWAAVNVRALAADGAAGDLLGKRVIKEAWRSLSIALGAADTMYRPCLLSPIHTLGDLDANPSLVVSPEPFTKMTDNAEALGICRVKRTSYRKACYEGWAPEPTNEYQRAIWDMVHQLPTEPIRIAPETRKVAR